MRQERTGNSSLSDNCREIATIIGGSVTAERVRKVIELSNNGRLMLHGIKTPEAIEEIQKEGILPLAPEGGLVSYWALGNRIFWSSSFSTPIINTYDTPFFHYGHSRDNQGRHLMAVAIANANDLGKIGGIQTSENSLVRINFPVPRRNIYFLQAILDAQEFMDLNPRERAQLLEQAMFGIIEEAFFKGRKRGQERIIQIHPS